MEDNNILAVVLAGGKSKRFGEDKNQTKLGDKTLLEHVLLKISNRYEEILIVSSHSIDTKKIKNVTIIPDCFDDFGPLAGVLSALRTPANGPKSSKQSGIIVTFFIFFVSILWLETISISSYLLLIFNKTCSNNVLSPSFVWFLSSPNLFDFPPASTTAKILLSSINQNIKH